MRHLDEGTIHAWLDGALDEAEARKAEHHAARCTPCAVAVADARGLIAASSRILTALDDVPAGVLPRGSRAAPPPAAPRRWGVRTMKIAASIAVVATGTLVVVRSGAYRTAEPVANRKQQLQLPPGVTLSVTPATAPESVPERAANEERKKDEADAVADKLDAGATARQQAPAVVAQNAPAATGGSLANPAAAAPLAAPASGKVATAPAAPVVTGAVSGGAAATPAPPPTPAPAAKPSGMQAAKPAASESVNATALPSGVASKAPKMKVEPGGPTTSGAQLDQMALAAAPPGMRLVSSEQKMEDARLVARRVYEVRPGLEVTLAIVGPPPTPAPAPPAADMRADAGVSDSADSARRHAFRSRAISDEAPGVNSIQWTDSTGTEFTLSGPLPLDSLRSLRARLPGRTQQRQ